LSLVAYKINEAAREERRFVSLAVQTDRRTQFPRRIEPLIESCIFRIKDLLTGFAREI
jgi:hypothetical protein